MTTKQKEMEEGQKSFLTRISEAADKVGETLCALDRKAEAARVLGLSNLSADLRYVEEVVREQIAAMRSASFAEVNRQFLAAQASSAAVVQAALAGVDIAKRQEAAAPAETAPPKRIPEGVYYSWTADNFFSVPTDTGMGTPFYTEWYARREEFPAARYPKTEPVPAFVYYDRENSNFYSMHDRSGMGREFFWRWKDRCQEFPTEPPAPAAASLAAEQAPAPIPAGVYFSCTGLFFDVLSDAAKGAAFNATWLSRASEFPRRWRLTKPANSAACSAIAMSEEDARQKFATYYGVQVSDLTGWAVSIY